MNTLKELFFDELAGMYDSEQRIAKALPKLIEAPSCLELKNVLQQHLQETEGQMAKLDRVFTAFDEKPESKKCPAMIGLIEEWERIACDHDKSAAINPAIISAAQKVEHYEIASYGCLRAWAELLGNREAARLLDEILNEERTENKTLNALAVAKNQEALPETETGATSGASSRGRRPDEV